ncbi:MULTISPECIES: hypothetical protein [unclassified Pseudomonas]|uniref:hypothetical protein n=1 Tax=unclassified Pseudomonas TaxID=196821 RepID=UPI00387AD4C4
MDIEIECRKCRKLVTKNSILREHVRPRFLDPKNPGGWVSVCRECSQLEAEHQYLEYKTFAISKNKEPYKNFLESIYELNAMINIRLPDKKLSLTMARILYATAITAMETYLSDTFINRVVNNGAHLRRCVETDLEFKNRKLELTDIFRRKETLKEEVQEYLAGVLFHNLAKVRLMYRTVLSIEFPADMTPLFKAVKTRHDIVHRGGKDKSGAITSIEQDEVKSLIITLKAFVKAIEEQLSNTAADPSSESTQDF